MKKYFKTNVLEESKKRIKFTFDNFENIYLSFSGGKDSTVMMHLAMEEAIKRKKKIGILIVDLEGQYKLTIQHMEKMINKYKKNIELFWVCLPIHLRNAVSMYGPFWKCWDKKRKDIWIREIPEKAISDINYFPFFIDGMEFEEFVPKFGEWYSKNKLTACMVGIRTQESLNRFRTIASMVKERFQDKGYSTKVTDHVYNVYPIYDWKTEDIWTFHGKYPQYEYNLLYDYMYKAGLPLKHMRICQPYGDDQRKGLWLFHLIEPETWAKTVARVSGANSGAKYIQEWGNMTGYRKITKPKGHTWESFAKLLLNSMPYKTGEHYKNKIWKFIKWWQSRGYPKGIPSEVDYRLEVNRLAPSWRRICKSLLRNDFWCKGLGYTQTKSSAYKKYLKFMKEKRQQERLL